MIIDSHCHLTYEPMSSSLDDTIKRANNDGVEYLLTISTEDKSFKKIGQNIKFAIRMHIVLGVWACVLRKRGERLYNHCIQMYVLGTPL